MARTSWSVLQLDDVVALSARLERERFVGGRGAGGELARLGDRAADQFGAADPGREAEVVLDPPRRPGLAAEHVALDHQRVQALRGAVDRRAEPRRPAADDQQVDLFARRQLEADAERPRQLAVRRPPQVDAARQPHQRDLLRRQVGDQRCRLGVLVGVAPGVGEPLAFRVLGQVPGRVVPGRPDDLEADALDPLQHFAALDEGREQRVGEDAVLEEQAAQRLAVDRDVAHRLGHDRGEEDGLAGEQVHLAEEPGRSVADDLAAVRVEDRRLPLADRDERVGRVADLEEDVADGSGLLLAVLGEHVDLGFREDAADGTGHAF